MLHRMAAVCLFRLFEIALVLVRLDHVASIQPRDPLSGLRRIILKFNILRSNSESCFT